MYIMNYPYNIQIWEKLKLLGVHYYQLSSYCVQGDSLHSETAWFTGNY
jgi:hypothetical protein